MCEEIRESFARVMFFRHHLKEIELMQAHCGGDDEVYCYIGLAHIHGTWPATPVTIARLINERRAKAGRPPTTAGQVQKCINELIAAGSVRLCRENERWRKNQDRYFIEEARANSPAAMGRVGHYLGILMEAAARIQRVYNLAAFNFGQKTPLSEKEQAGIAPIHFEAETVDSAADA